MEKLTVNEVDITDLYKKHFKDVYNPYKDDHEEITDVKKTLVGSIFTQACVEKENGSYCDYIEPGMMDMLKRFYDFFDDLEKRFAGKEIEN